MKMNTLSRRRFLAGVAASMAAAPLMQNARAADNGEFPPLPRAVVHGMLPDDLSWEERYALAARCGFEGVEAPPFDNEDEARRHADAAAEAGIHLHSVIFGGWRDPLSHADESVAAAGLNALEMSIRGASIIGADAVLLVPGRVNAENRYVEVYERSQRRIREILPLAEELEVVIAVENVWNDFLLSPLEFAQYVDEFESPWLRAYFDVGNVVAFGWPQDWIRTLGERIVKIHYKDFTRSTRDWEALGEGDVDWVEVRRALHEVGYDDFVTAELSDGDEAYLTDVAERMDRINRGVTVVES